MIAVKRAYDAPDKHDGYRVLVDRLWPRGMRKEKAAIDAWEKAVAPSAGLRKWFGHDPARGEIYGWASWSAGKGILSFRNPSDKPGKITIDIGKAFELPDGAAQAYSLKSPWRQDAGKEAIVLAAGKEHTFELKPFEVLVFDATPR